MKDAKKGKVISNNRPIACLLLANVKIILIQSKIIQSSSPEESKGTTDQLLIDKAILQNCKRTCKGLAMGWIDYKKAYDTVPHLWVAEGSSEACAISGQRKETPV